MDIKGCRVTLLRCIDETKRKYRVPSVPAVINNYERTIVAVIRDENIVKLKCTVELNGNLFKIFNGKYFHP